MDTLADLSTPALIAAYQFFCGTTTANPCPALGCAYAKLTALFDQVCEYLTNQLDAAGSQNVYEAGNRGLSHATKKDYP